MVSIHYFVMKVQEAAIQHKTLMDYGYVSWKDIFITNYQ